MHNMVANLLWEQLWEYLSTGLQADIRAYMKRVNKDSLDLAPASSEICLQAIINVGIDVKNNKQYEQ